MQIRKYAIVSQRSTVRMFTDPRARIRVIIILRSSIERRRENITQCHTPGPHAATCHINLKIFALNLEVKLEWVHNK